MRRGHWQEQACVRTRPAVEQRERQREGREHREGPLTLYLSDVGREAHRERVQTRLWRRLRALEACSQPTG